MVTSFDLGVRFFNLLTLKRKETLFEMYLCLPRRDNEWHEWLGNYEGDNNLGIWPNRFESRIMSIAENNRRSLNLWSFRGKKNVLRQMGFTYLRWKSLRSTILLGRQESGSSFGFSDWCVFRSKTRDCVTVTVTRWKQYPF